MKKLLFIALLAALLISACTVNNARPEMKQDVEEYTGLTTKVGILPLKSLDASSRNMNRVLTVRDFDYVFATHPKYELLDMDAVEQGFKSFGIPDVDDLEPEEMKEIADETGANVLIVGNISADRSNSFALAFKLFSARTNELRQVNFNVTNDKFARWKTMDENLMAELDRFISTEVEKIFNFATNFYATGNYAEAERQLNLAIGLDPENKDAYYYLGATKFKTQNYAAAEEHFNHVLTIDPNHLQTLRMMNDMYEAQGDTAKRLAIMERIATINEDEELWLAVGNLYAENNNTVKAEQALRNALNLKSDYTLAQTRLAFLLYDTQRFGDAIQYLESAYDAFPENDIISRRLAISYQRSGRMNEAIERYEGLIRNNPNNAQAYLNVVSLYRQQATEATDPAITQEMNNKAINTMNELKRVAPDNPLAYLNLASIFLAQGQNADAESNANLTLEKDPTLYQPYVILATVNQTKGTNDYNRFVDLEKRAANAVGREATRLSGERDAAKAAANANFRKAVEQLNAAKLRASEPEAVTDITNRLSRLQTLVNQTSGY
ncbi:MAG: tetratricopeptide repeat protein [Candidatus Cloacimonetes bacterium]|nr:tetratricopeptide repeat protein [Candidatus Cloacimonadota bacterium]MDD3097046.1 tetratricopeptide repeat protein [Candidatus Cloacimonadota bacterium]MDD3578489.1 tetratricopeptide repeat protein [Candidatus Cloacimonadota bacterium]